MASRLEEAVFDHHPAHAAIPGDLLLFFAPWPGQITSSPNLELRPYTYWCMGVSKNQEALIWTPNSRALVNYKDTQKEGPKFMETAIFPTVTIELRMIPL